MQPRRAVAKAVGASSKEKAARAITVRLSSATAGTRRRFRCFQIGRAAAVRKSGDP
jgi:hypothetical protein